MKARNIRNIDPNRCRVFGDDHKPIVFLAARSLSTMNKKPEWKPDPETWLVIDSREQAEQLMSLLKEIYQL